MPKRIIVPLVNNIIMTANNLKRSSFGDGGVGNVRELGDGLRTRADVQFLVDAPDVRVDRGHADVQRLGDFLVEIATREEFQHFALARREIVWFGGRGAAEPLERLDDLARN